MSQLLKSSGAMAAATLTSRVLGMVREMVYAAFMGNTWVASAFTLAFQVPNLFRRLLGEGALTAAFIPFKQRKSAGREMWRTANAVISDWSWPPASWCSVGGISVLFFGKPI
jgi:putative peptidoglycan lipid II flippase